MSEFIYTVPATPDPSSDEEFIALGKAAGVTVSYESTWVDRNGKEEPMPEDLRCWAMRWEKGAVSFDTLRKANQMEQALIAAGVFVHLWRDKEVSAALAERLAASYAYCYSVG
jgi:hypothetical protein